MKSHKVSYQVIHGTDDNSGSWHSDTFTHIVTLTEAKETRQVPTKRQVLYSILRIKEKKCALLLP